MIKVVLVLLSYNIHAFEKCGGLDLTLGFTLDKCRSVCLSRAAHWGHQTGLPRDSGVSQLHGGFVPFLEPSQNEHRHCQADDN